MLLKFRTDKGRDPSCDSYSEDSELLLQIRNDVLDSMGVTPDLLPDDFVRLVPEQIDIQSLKGDSCAMLASYINHLLPVQ